MKKLLKLTLFKKNFIIIFACLMIIEGFHIYLDYDSEVKSIVSYMASNKNADLLENLGNQLSDNINKNYKDKNFFKEFGETFKEEWGYYAILDEDGVIIHEKTVNNLYGVFPDMWLIQKDNMGYSSNVNLSNLKEEDLKKLDNYISNSFTAKKDSPIYVEFSGKRKTDEEFVTSYLKIGNDIIFGEDKQKNAEVYLIESYKSDKYRYTSYSNNGNPTLTNYESIYDVCREMVDGKYEFYGMAGNLDKGFRKADNNLFTIIYKPILNNGDENIRGYLVNISYNIDCLDELLDVTISSKQNVYILAFGMTIVMSFLISYLTTKRVKAINNVTHNIANKNFDITLKERPRDELGELSNSINSMSQQLKQTIEQLNLEIEKVKELESLRKDFINQFTHEMKTPLGIINGYSELIEESKNEEEVNKYLNIINRETNRVNELIQSMLKLSRLEAKKVELNKQDIDLEESVVSIVDEYEVLLMKKNIKVEVNVVQSTISADKKLIETVIHNFLSNAIKHTGENHKIIIDIDNGVNVFNEGKPIEDDKIENIWYTFVTHDREGSGLGLAICRSILDLHDFMYGVENKENGVSFYFKD